jgi:adenine-specific DNA methylase
VRWVVRRQDDKLLDPACGDGRFLEFHRNSVGVDCDVDGVIAATRRSGHATIHVSDFFEWASASRERFDCVAGNPPFIRYQHFAGAERENALRICARLGVRFTALTSSWAPFLAAAASLLKPGGRMAFVVPAEIGHAPYAAPLLRFLCGKFSHVQLIALQTKLFPELSEDVWVLFADGYSRSADHILLTAQRSFGTGHESPPGNAVRISLREFQTWNNRIRPFLLPKHTREFYRIFRDSARALRLGDIARIGIGYVSGANDFFHLPPSAVKMLGIPEQFLIPTVRNARTFAGNRLTHAVVKNWIRKDDAMFLLRLPKCGALPDAVSAYLDTPAGLRARKSYKCQNRTPWYAVPDVRIPDAFLSYMSGEMPQLVANDAKCTCTNSIHAVTMLDGWHVNSLLDAWQDPVVALSCELEGHALGGGMLKIEPREAARLLIPRKPVRWARSDLDLICQGTEALRKWRHYA